MTRIPLFSGEFIRIQKILAFVSMIFFVFPVVLLSHPDPPNCNSKIDPNKPFNYDHPAYELADSLLKAAEKSQISQDFLSAITLYNEVGKRLKSQGCWEPYLWGKINILNIYFRYTSVKNRWREAAPHLREALLLEDDKLKSDHIFRSSIYFYEGKYHFLAMQADSAVTAFKKCIDIREAYFKMLSPYLAYPYYELGNTFLDLTHDIKQSEKYFNKYFEISSDPSYPVSEDWYFSYHQTMGSLNLAQKFYELGDPDKSLSYTYHTVEAIPKLDRNQAYFSYYTQYLQGVNWIEKKHYKAADSLLLTSLTTLAESELSASSLFGELQSYVFLELGNSAFLQDQYRVSKRYFDKAIAQLGGRNQENYKLIKAQAFSGLGKFYQAEKNWELGKEQFLQSIHYWEGVPYQEDKIAVVYFNLGELSFLSDETEEALGYYDKGISVLKEIDNNFEFYPSLAIHLLAGKAQAIVSIASQSSNQEQTLELAYTSYEHAIVLLEKTFHGFDREATKILFKKNTYSIYEGALECLFKLYEKGNDSALLKKVFYVMEESKARLILEQYLELQFQQSLSGKNLKELQLIRNTLALLQSQLLEREATHGVESIPFMELHSRLLETEARKEYLLKKIGEEPTFESIGLIRSPDSLINNLKLLLNTGSYEGLVSYYYGQNAIYGLSFSKDAESYFHKFPISSREQSLLISYHQELAGGYQNKNRVKQYRSLTQKALKIYQLFVKPMVNQILLLDKEKEGKIPNVVFLTDGLLNFIPLETLLIDPAPDDFVGYDRLNYILNKIGLSYAPSFRTLFWKKAPSISKVKKIMLAFGYSDSLRKSISSLRIFGQNALPGTSREIDSISHYLPTKEYKGSNAKKTTFLKLIPNFLGVHLSLHGEGNSNFQSRLIFPGGNREEDMILYPHELLGLDLSGQMVVLSACESGIGTYIEGEGMHSMANGFLQAGASSVLMSLWRVDDDFTVDLMANFYRHLSKRKSLDFAIHQAKKEFISLKGPYLSFPGNWGSFVLSGKGLTPDFESGSQNGLMQLMKGITIIFIFLLIIIFLYKMIV